MQKIFKVIYPLRIRFSEVTGIGKKSVQNKNKTGSLISFYSLNGVLNNGKIFSFETLKGKYVILVNTASNCGYTSQYNDLEKLFLQYKDRLVVLGFPANNFGGQEPDTDENIIHFCNINYNITFPLFQKASVVGNDMQPIFQWLTDPKKNGWNDQTPTWNFCKYLVDPTGTLIDFYSSAVSPLNNEIINILNKLLF